MNINQSASKSIEFRVDELNKPNREIRREKYCWQCQLNQNDDYKHFADIWNLKKTNVESIKSVWFDSKILARIISKWNEHNWFIISIW